MMNKVLRTVGGMLAYQFSVPFVAMLVVIGLTSFVTVNIVRKNPEALGLLKGQELLLKEEEGFIKQVGESIALPDEKPAVATVTDLDKLTGQAFFASAENGDKVLIYQDAGKVILYRPSENRVVEVGTVNIQEQQQEGSEIESSLKVGLLNGTDEDQVAEDFEKSLQEREGVEVVSRTDALKGDYEKSIVVNVNGIDSEEAARRLAEDLGIEVGELPDGEAEIEGVEIVIVLGEDQG